MPAMKTAPKRRNAGAMQLHIRTFAPEIRTDNLPDGICGIVTGIAVVYNVWDSYGTRFREGSLDKTRNKVAARKVKFFANHGQDDGYGIRTHVGTVASLVRSGNIEVFTAELFDTDEGRHAKAYVEAVMKSRSETGASIGFFPIDGDDVVDAAGRYEGWEFTEIALDEISLAPRNSVPGSVMTHVRKTASPALLAELLRPLCARMSDEDLLALIRETRAGTDAADDESSDDAPPAPPAENDGRDERRSDADSPQLATMDERMKALRESYAVT